MAKRNITENLCKAHYRIEMVPQGVFHNNCINSFLTKYFQKYCVLHLNCHKNKELSF